MARVSNPNAKPEDSSGKLIQYLLDHKHFSPFEMASICVEITTTRDISRQILRHRSFHFQEFSQRYSAVDSDPIFRVARLQDKTNRQNSIVTKDKEILEFWEYAQKDVWNYAEATYDDALAIGIAKEQARALLPEGLTPTKMFMHGTVRDWFHYLTIRTGPETQLEHRQVANEILEICTELAPAIFERIKDE